MIKSDKCMGFSQLLGARVRAAPPKSTPMVATHGYETWTLKKVEEKRNQASENEWRKTMVEVGKEPLNQAHTET